MHLKVLDIDVVKGDKLCSQVAPGRRNAIKQENLVDPSPMGEQQVETVCDIAFESIRIGFVDAKLFGEELVARPMVEVDPVSLCVDEAAKPYST